VSDFEGAVERVWPGKEAHVEVLGGGITNHNLKVVVDGEAFVLRVTGKDTGLLGIDRTVELARGKYCWMMSDDDILTPDAVAAVGAGVGQPRRSLCGQ